MLSTKIYSRVKNEGQRQSFEIKRQTIALTLIKNNKSNWETSVNYLVYLDTNDFWFRFFSPVLTRGHMRLFIVHLP